MVSNWRNWLVQILSESGEISQGPSSRFEEYITLRDELLRLQAFCRQILYWSMSLVFLGLGWYLRDQGSDPQSSRGMPGDVFGLFLLLALLMSNIVYNSQYTAQYRVGTYLAVFWESSNEQRRLRWHRFNRNAPGVQTIFLYRHIGALIYTTAALAIAFVIYWFGQNNGGVWTGSMWVLAIIDICTFISLSENVQTRREEDEKNWILIKKDSEMQKSIHRYYGDDV